MKRLLSSVLIMCLCVSLCIDCAAQSPQYSAVMEETALRMVNEVKTPSVGPVGGEWLIMGLKRSGAKVSDTYFEEYYKRLCDYTAEHNGVLHDKKYTEYSRVVLALSAMGKNPFNVGGFDLISPLCDFDKVVLQGINGPVFALIALDSKGYELPQPGIKERYIGYILERQNPDGGFALSAESDSDVDITAMAAAALAKYKNDEKCKQAIEKALGFLSANQLDSGRFISGGEENSESCCQVLTALSALGIADDDRFVKNGNTVVSALLSFYIEGEGFTHLKGEKTVNQMANEQSLYALCAYDRMKKGENALYDMTDSGENNTWDSAEATLLEKMETVNQNADFTDIGESKYRNEITALSQKGIIRGKGGGIFDPAATMTRSEFASITANALSAPPSYENPFEDVKESDWFYKNISSAYSAGIIKGVSETLFNPYGTITREEAAAMTVRCASILGMDASIGDDAAQNILAQFDDYIKISPWARASVAFCVREKIFDDDELEILPQKSISREEIAHMLYILLTR